MKLNLSHKIIISFLVIIVCCLITFSINLRFSGEVKRNAESFKRSESVLRASGNIRITILEMDNAFRGFLLTDNEKFLAPYRMAVDSIPKLLNQEKNLLEKSPTQIASIDTIKILLRQWLSYSDEVIKAKFERLDPNVVSFKYDTLLENKVKKEVGRRLVEEINHKLNTLEQYEYHKSKKNREKLDRSMAQAKYVSLLLAILTTTIGLISAFYITHVITKRIKSMVHLAESISVGHFEHINDESEDELSKLSDSLNIMSEKLKRSFLELDQYAHVVSHDLKAPLRGINNVISWIEEDFIDELSPRLLEYFEKIKGRSQRMEDLIFGLLEYSRIRAIKNSKEEIDVKQLLEEIVDSIVPASFKVTIQSGMPVLFTERLVLHQVFANLISNSVKYNESKQGLIWISCSEVGESYQFIVKDNGVGIAPEHHKKIFGIFQTLRDKNDKESTGIGLSIVKKIIEEKRGKIDVVSTLGKGTSIIFTWPK